MSQTILTISEITREQTRVLVNNLTFAKFINRQYNKDFAIPGAKIGATINIRKPARYVGRTGPTLSIENQTETYAPLTLSKQRGVDVQFTTQDMTLSMDEFSERFVKPAAATVANFIDSDGLALYTGVQNFVGTPGTTANSLLTYLNAGALMDNMAAPRDQNRAVCINPIGNATLTNALTNIFNPAKEISEQYKTGNMGLAAGFKFSMDQNVQTQTIGTFSGTPLVNGANQTGSSLITDGWGDSATALLNVGDIFTIAGVYAVNPQSRQSTGQLANFVVTATATSDVSGNSTVSIYPAITISGQFQTVNAVPADNAALTVYGASGTVTPTNLAYHKDAFVLGFADLLMPRGVHMASRISDDQLGISLRMVQAYDINNDLLPCRLDVLYGYATIYPELACRIQG